MLPFPLENNLFLVSTLDAVVLLRYPHCSPIRPRSMLTPGFGLPVIRCISAAVPREPLEADGWALVIE